MSPSPVCAGTRVPVSMGCPCLPQLWVKVSAEVPFPRHHEHKENPTAMRGWGSPCLVPELTPATGTRIGTWGSCFSPRVSLFPSGESRGAVAVPAPRCCCQVLEDSRSAEYRGPQGLPRPHAEWFGSPELRRRAAANPALGGDTAGATNRHAGGTRRAWGRGDDTLSQS